MKIWVHLNGVQQGPYTFDQLQQLPINAATPVWYDGLPQWMPAGQAPATAPLFAAPMPPTPQPQAQMPPQPQVIYVQTPPSKPSTYLVWSILLTVLCCTPFSVAAIVTGAIVNSNYRSGNHRGAQRMSTVTEWLIILSIVCGLVFWPFSLLTWL